MEVSTAMLYEVVEKAKKYDELLQFKGNIGELSCSFCGNKQSQVKKLIPSSGVCICDDCVVLCSEIIEGEEKENIEQSET